MRYVDVFVAGFHYSFLLQSEIPEKWRAATLSKIDVSPADQVSINIVGPCYYSREFLADPVTGLLLP